MDATKEFQTPMTFCPGFKELRRRYQGDALFWSVGDSSYQPSTSQAGKNFCEFRFKTTATSGDNRAWYLRYYLSGTGGGGECLRAFTTVNNVTVGTAHGAHLSLNFGTTGKLTGLGVAVRGTLHIPNQAMSGGGTYAALQAEIYSDGANSDPAGMTRLAAIRVVNDGNASGKADVDDDAVLFDFAGWTAGAGHLISAVGNEPTWASKTYKLKCKLPDGTTGYLVAVID